jgi:hypothetical protein
VETHVNQIATAINGAVEKACAAASSPRAAPPSAAPQAASAEDAAILPASNCFASGSDVQITVREAADLVAQASLGRSPEDIRADIEALNRSRGGSGTAVCPALSPNSTAPLDADQSRALRQRIKDRDSAALADLLEHADRQPFCDQQHPVPTSIDCLIWTIDHERKFELFAGLEGYLVGLDFVGTAEARASKIADLDAELADLQFRLFEVQHASPECAEAWEHDAMVSTPGCHDAWRDIYGYRRQIENVRGSRAALTGESAEYYLGQQP